MDDDVSNIVDAVRAKQPPAGMSTRIVAVDGPGGAGKSMLADRIASVLGNAPIVHTDDFASWDVPLDWWPRLRDEVLEPLKRGEHARYRRSSWGERTDDAYVEIPASEFVVLEGVSASREAFRPFLTYSVWVETRRDVRLSRGLARDGEEARSLWERWMAEEDAYVAREDPRGHADIVVRGDRDL